MPSSVHPSQSRPVGDMSKLRSFLKTWWSKFCNTVYRMQLAHYGGAYSIERMLALQEYTSSTSLLRVLLVVMSPPLFTAAVLLLQESVPLQDPNQGWQANWGFWIRVGVLGIANGHEAITQIPPWLNVPSFSSRQVAVFSFFTGVGLVAGGMAVAEMWVFPLPFFILTLSLVLSAVLVGLMRAVAGKATFKLITSRKEELKRLNNIASLETIMCAGYPVFQLLFTKVSGTHYELPVILLLSVIQLMMKRIFRSAASHVEDTVPKQVIFTVDFFGSFYLATFMQRLAPVSLLVIMMVDVAESVVELHELNQRTRRILARLNEVTEVESESKPNLLEAIGGLLNDTDIRQNKMHALTRAHSRSTPQLSTSCKVLKQKIGDNPLVGPSDTNIYPQGKTHMPAQLSSVVPLSGRLHYEKWTKTKMHPVRTVANPSLVAVATLSIAADRKSDPVKEGRASSKSTNAAILNECREVLFTSECLVLTEYVEIIIPLMYGLFILVTVHLPSAVYHSEMEGVTLDNVGSMVSRIYVYALLEFASFVVLAVISKRNCGINVLYQLAFVLETEIAFVPSKLLLWILYTLTYRVKHFGPGFSFQFEWIKNQSSG